MDKQTTSSSAQLTLTQIVQKMDAQTLDAAAQHLTDWLSGYNVGHADRNKN